MINATIAIAKIFSLKMAVCFPGSCIALPVIHHYRTEANCEVAGSLLAPRVARIAKIAALEQGIPPGIPFKVYWQCIKGGKDA